MFDTNHDGVINFREFILGISVFSDCQDIMVKENIRMGAIRINDKIEYSMRITDINRKNRIYVKDIENILVSIIEEKNFFKLSRKQIKKIVKNTFKTEKVFEDEIGKYWDFQSYSKMVMKNPQIFKWLAVDIESFKEQIKLQKKVTKCLSV